MLRTYRKAHHTRKDHFKKADKQKIRRPISMNRGHYNNNPTGRTNALFNVILQKNCCFVRVLQLYSPATHQIALPVFK